MAISSEGLRRRVTALARPRSNCTVNCRPVLSSERALQTDKHATVRRKFQGERKNWSHVPNERLTPRHTGQLTVGRNLASTSFSTNLYKGQSTCFTYHRTILYQCINSKNCREITCDNKSPTNVNYPLLTHPG
jgi:hypothetical protein